MRRFAVCAALFVIVLVVGCCSDACGATNPAWPRRMEQVALPKDALPKVIETHPRLYVRAEPWKYGLSVADLRERAKKEPWARRFKTAPKGGEALALYYLATGDESVVPKIVEEVAKRDAPSNLGKYGTVPLDPAILMYDWVCSSRNVTDAQKQAMQEALVKIAETAARQQERAIDLMHHWGAGTCPTNVLAAGLALYGDHPAGEKFLAQALGYFRAAYLPAYKATGGVWQGGGRAYFEGRAEVIPWGIYLWASGTNEDIFDIIKKDHGNWFEGMMHYAMYQTLPDATRTDLCGFDYAPKHPFPWGRNFMIFAAGNRSPLPYAFMRWAKQKGYYRMTLPEADFLLYDERLDKEAAPSLDAMPGAMLWGRDGAGYAQFRYKGWAPDATVVEFKCGDHFWSHTHNANQNSFYIFHKGRLAIQSGIYQDATYFGNHTQRYYARTVSSNSMLIIDPEEFSTAEKAGLVNGSDADNCYPEYGGQRLIRGSCNTFTFAEYLARKTAIPSEVRGNVWQFWETGDIAAFDHAPDYRWAYVCGDATQAYNNPQRIYQLASGRKNRAKIDLFTRSMVFLDGANLIVFDRVNALDPSFRKAWLLHSQAKPEVSGKLIKADVPGHIEDFDGDTVVVTWGDSLLPPPDPKDTEKGRLIVKTYLPRERYIRRIGGGGYEFWTGDANHPPARRGSATIDKPDDGNWRIEVSPAKPANFDNFLHCIHICDTKTKDAPPGLVISEAGGKMVGLAVGGWAVMFGVKGEVDGAVKYTAPPGAKNHLVVDLVRGGRYRLSIPDREARELAASKEGTLTFAAPDGADVNLTPVR